MTILTTNFGALILHLEKLYGAHIFFHDYHGVFIKSLPAHHHNHAHSFCINYKEKNLQKCIKFEGDTCNEKSFKQNDGFWKICPANALELYLPLIHPINKTRAGAIFIGVFQPTQPNSEMLVALHRENQNTNHSLLPIINNEKMDLIYHSALLLKYFIEHEILIQNKNLENSFDRKESIVYYLNENLKNSITLNTLAEFLKVSYSRAGQIIKENFNKSFPELLLEIRMDQARSLLSGSDMNIKKVSEECGFKEPEYFHKLFKNKFQITPLKFRKEHFDKNENKGFDV
jgi:AraC-like DNA-binding protein